jgi:hypothetical protein
VIEETLTPLEKYQRTIEDLNKLYHESKGLLGEQGLSYEAYVRAVEKAQKDLEAATVKSNEFRLEAARSTEAAIADALLGGMEGKFSEIDDLFINMINRMVAHALAAKLATKLFGDISGNSAGGGGWLDKAWDAFNSSGGIKGLGSKALGAVGGLFRDTGGRAYPGRPHFIGTSAQPEVFVPDTAGDFFPVDQWLGMGGARINQNIYLQGSTDPRTPRQIALATERQQRIAQMKFGR